MAKRFRVKGYKKLRKNAPQIKKVKGKVKLRAGKLPKQIVQFVSYSCSKNQAVNNLPNFYGPSLQQRLYGYALASTSVIVNMDDTSFMGRVISVDDNAFEVTVTDPLNSNFVVGAIVTVSFAQVNAIAAGQ